MAGVLVDCRKLSCPQPVVRLKRLFEEGGERPERLTVLVDNEPALENVSRFLQASGYTTQHLQDGSLWRITGKSTGLPDIPVPSAKPQPDKLVSPETAKTLILIPTAVLGSGDDKLGSRLMGTFLSTLPEMTPSLWRIILLNGGVTLAAEDSPVIEALRVLEHAGVSILVCGTCLEHFGLLRQKAVGQVTNMLDIVTSMQVVERVIRV